MSDRRKSLEHLADRMLQLKCLATAARARGDMQRFYKGNRMLFEAQSRFNEGELGIFLKKDALCQQIGDAKVAL